MGWFDAVRFMRAHHDETLKIAAQMTGMPLAIQEKEYEIALPMFNTGGHFDAGDPGDLEALLRRPEACSIPPPDMAKLYTEEFLPK